MSLSHYYYTNEVLVEYVFVKVDLYPKEGNQVHALLKNTESILLYTLRVTRTPRPRRAS
jgi:hypothetical protein